MPWYSGACLVEHVLLIIAWNRVFARVVYMCKETGLCLSGSSLLTPSKWERTAFLKWRSHARLNKFRRALYNAYRKSNVHTSLMNEDVFCMFLDFFFSLGFVLLKVLRGNDGGMHQALFWRPKALIFILGASPTLRTHAELQCAIPSIEWSRKPLLAGFDS